MGVASLSVEPDPSARTVSAGLASWVAVSRAVGGLSAALVTVTVRVLSLVKLPSLARTVAAEIPTGSDDPGAKWMFPVVALVVVTVMNVGPETLDRDSVV